MKTDHFGGKSVKEHLKEARTRGAQASAEIHGVEIPGHWAAGADAARETAFLLGLLFLIFHPSFWALFMTALGILIWKVGRSALLGWARLERLHRLIEEERWEIEHHRPEEEEELTALYQAKGFSGQLLKDVVSTLSSDDNRLLQIMLEEEMGLTLEVYEHPLKQASGAGIGVISSSALVLLASFGDFWGIVAMVGAITIASTWIMAHLQKNRLLESIIWSLAIVIFGLGVVYFLQRII